MRRINRSRVAFSILTVCGCAGLAGCSEPTAPVIRTARPAFNGMIGMEDRGDTTKATAASSVIPPMMAPAR